MQDEIPNYERNFRLQDGTQQIVEHDLEGTCEYFLAENTIKLIDAFSQRNKPFFIWHNTWGPHGAYLCHSSFYDLYKDVCIPEPKNFEAEPGAMELPSKVKRLHGDKQWQYFAEDRKLYYALTTQIDAMLGRILRHLEEKRLADNTVIIFTSDHGTHFGMHGGLIDKGFSHYEEAQRTGCVIFDPRRQKKSVISQYTGLIDIYPTVLDFAEIKPPKEADGKSLRPLIQGEVCSWRDHAFVEFYGLGNILTTMLTIVFDGYKYGWNASNNDEFYDLSKDPLEMHNSIDAYEYEKTIRILREKMYEHMREHNNPLQYIFKINVLQKKYPNIWGTIPH